MSNVLFKRSTDVDNIPIVDGQVIFDELNNKIYMDNGNQRLQYGGDVSLISNIDYATANNAFSALATKNIFVRQNSVVDNKDSILAATEGGLPAGCLGIQSIIGNSNYSAIGNTVSSALLTLNNNINNVNTKFTNQLKANSHDIYMDYKNGKYGYNTSSSRGADTFHPFSGYEYLGTGTSFNVSNISGYQNLTVSNFVCEPVDIAVIPSNYGYNGGGGHNVGQWGITGGSGGITKSYDASTGVLTAYLSASCGCGVNSHSVASGSGAVAVKCYLIIS